MFDAIRTRKSEKYGVDWERVQLLGGNCSLCTRRLSLVELRRHCRLCGKVMCGSCKYPERLFLIDGESAKTVCDPCGQQRHLGQAPSDRCKPTAVHFAMAEASAEQGQGEEMAGAHIPEPAVSHFCMLSDPVVEEQDLDGQQLGEDPVPSGGSTTPGESCASPGGLEAFDEECTPTVYGAAQPVGDVSGVDEFVSVPCCDGARPDEDSPPKKLVPSADVRAELDRAFGEQVVDRLVDVAVMQQRVNLVASVLQKRAPVAKTSQLQLSPTQTSTGPENKESTPSRLVPSPAVRAELDSAFGEHVVDQLLDTSVMRQRVAIVASVLQRSPVAEAMESQCAEIEMNLEQQEKAEAESSPSSPSPFATPRSPSCAQDSGEEFSDVAEASAEEIQSFVGCPVVVETATKELRTVTPSVHGDRDRYLHKRRADEQDVEFLRACARRALTDGDEDGRLDAVLQQLHVSRAATERERRRSVKAAIRRYSGIVLDLLTGRVSAEASDSNPAA